MSEKTIQKITFNISSNNNLYVRIWTNDMSLTDSPIDIFKKPKVLFILLCKTVGDSISIKEDGDFFDINEDNSKKDIEKLYKNIKNGFEAFIKGNKVEITENELSDFINQYSLTFNKVAKYVDDSIVNNALLLTTEDRDRMIREIMFQVNRNYIILS